MLELAETIFKSLLKEGRDLAVAAKLLLQDYGK